MHEQAKQVVNICRQTQQWILVISLFIMVATCFGHS